MQRVTTLLMVLTLASCDTNTPLSTEDDAGVASDGAPSLLSALRTNKVDVLFMVDNSPSMGAMQAELLTKFPTFLDVFDTLAHPTDGSTPLYADIHVGVVTSDYGAGDVAGGGCDASPGGQKGLLQAKGAAADASCGTPIGASFIQYAFGADVDTCNLPGGCTPTSLGAQFTCMASVGAAGCGFEHQLESVHAALTTSDPTNAGFLRPDALLAVVFLTNEDDGSAPPSVDFYNPDPSRVGQYGAYTTFRQTEFGVECATAVPEGASNGPLLSCGPYAAYSSSSVGGEYDLARYIDLFTTPNMLKPDPTNDIILVAVDAPTTPFETMLAQTDTGLGTSPNPAYVACGALGSTCVAALQHSCQNAKSPGFFGDPPVRLDAVIKSQHFNQTFSICGDDLATTPDYSPALQNVAKLIVSTMHTP